MVISREVEEMCVVKQGVHHGAAPIPEEAKWVQAKEDRKSTRLNSSHIQKSRMPSSA